MNSDDRVFDELYQLAAGRVNSAARTVAARLKPGGEAARDAAEVIWTGLFAGLDSLPAGGIDLKEERVAVLVRHAALNFWRAGCEMADAENPLSRPRRREDGPPTRQ